MRSAAKFLAWLGLSMIALGGAPALALSCGGQVMQEHGGDHGEHGHHMASGGITASDPGSAGDCCDDCVMPCVSPGGTLLLLAPVAGATVCESRQAPVAPPDALPASPPLPSLYRPPIAGS